MFIQTEPTPNPATLKFLPNVTVMDHGSADFQSADAAKRSPLAVRLFEIEGVAAVFLGSDFITVTKGKATDWNVVKPQILGAIMDHFTAGRPVIEADEAEDGGGAGDDPIVRKIKELLDTRIRPAVAQDGGDIVFRKFEDGVVFLNMQGACSGCPSATATLRNGVENMLRYYVPEVKEVRQIS